MKLKIGRGRKGVFFKILAVLFPLVAAISVMPFILEMPPLAIPPNINIFQVLIVLPWYLGLVAAPGYLYVLLYEPEGSSMGIAKRKWVRASLLCAIAASVGGLTAVLAVIPAPFVLGSIAFSVLVWRDFNSDANGAILK